MGMPWCRAIAATARKFSREMGWPPHMLTVVAMER
jgi:hypothetical protein